MVKYINAETGKEVKYGEYITYYEEGEVEGGKFKRTTTLPVVKESIPSLLKKGVIVQKKIKEGKENTSSEITSQFLTAITEGIVSLNNKIGDLLEILDKKNE